MKNLPIGIQTFSKFKTGNYLYIDKTREIHQLLSEGGEYYFLSRPRRFGKSLLVSTLLEIFSGNKELFKDLWIYDKIQWEKYPVIHLDFTEISFKTPEVLENSLKRFVHDYAGHYGLTTDKERDYKEAFVKLIKELSVKGRVVILIDEYDKPIINHVENQEIEKAKEMRNVLKNFYGVIKGLDEYLRFVFITGVSKFSKVSVFSDLNNLRDVTLSGQFSTLLGYTEEELQHYFDRHIEIMADELDFSKSRLIENIRKWYNGYSWDGKNFVYNPFSILNLFKEKTFENFWFSTGTPSFLINIIKNKRHDITGFEELPVSSYAFDSFEIDNMDISALLFQTGYLTIKKIYLKREKKRYRLSYPNKEVRDSFLTYLFRDYTQKDVALTSKVIDRVVEAIEENSLDRLMEELKALFASIPYHIFIGEKEAYYHTVIYLILKLAGADVKPEDSTNIGRIDAVFETQTRVYIMEFKIGSEQEALEQIKKMKYYEKYFSRGKEIVLVGIGFDPEKRNIGGYVQEEERRK
jgi:hypothetical protein